MNRLKLFCSLLWLYVLNDTHCAEFRQEERHAQKCACDKDEVNIHHRIKSLKPIRQTLLPKSWPTTMRAELIMHYLWCVHWGLCFKILQSFPPSLVWYFCMLGSVFGLKMNQTSSSSTLLHNTKNTPVFSCISPLSLNCLLLSKLLLFLNILESRNWHLLWEM